MYFPFFTFKVQGVESAVSTTCQIKFSHNSPLLLFCCNSEYNVFSNQCIHWLQISNSCPDRHQRRSIFVIALVIYYFAISLWQFTNLCKIDVLCICMDRCRFNSFMIALFNDYIYDSHIYWRCFEKSFNLYIYVNCALTFRFSQVSVFRHKV